MLSPLIVGLVAGGVGGAVGYELAGSGSQVTSALDLPAPGAVPIANLPSGSVEQVAQKVTPSVGPACGVHGAQLAAEGSGIVLSADGLILTNNHVVEPAAAGGQLAAVLQDGRSVPVQIVGRAPAFDLAVVRVRGSTASSRLSWEPQAMSGWVKKWWQSARLWVCRAP